MAVQSFENPNKLAPAHKLLKTRQLCVSEKPVEEKKTGSSSSKNVSTSRVIRTKLFEWKPPSKMATKFILADTEV